MSSDDELLAIRCQLGEAAAIDTLIARWHGALWSYARRVTGADDAADDVVQDVWMHVIAGLPRLRDAARIRAWMFGIARRRLMDRLRIEYARPHMADDINIEDVHAPAVDDDPGLELERMLGALGGLPVIEREVLSLFYLQELSLNELSDVLGVPVGTVKSRLFRARRLLKDRMDPARAEESHR